MNPVPAQREYFLDSIRAWLMLLGIPFHISLIYSSHTWHVNSAEPSLWLTLFNDFIHSFRMQVFFVISEIIGNLGYPDIFTGMINDIIRDIIVNLGGFFRFI